MLATGCAARSPRPVIVDYHDFAPTLDSIYTRVGKYEVLFCVDADSTARGWTVTRISLPAQTADSVSVFTGNCAGHVGDIHNHPAHLGGDYRGAEPGASPIDFKSFKQIESLRFMTVWRRAGAWISYTKK